MAGDFLNMTNITGDDGISSELSWPVWVKEIVTPIIVIAGIVGNILGFVVMSSRPLRHKSYSFYLRALSIFDSFNLIDRQFLAIDELYITFEKRSILSNLGNASCKILRFSESVFCLMSSWLVVLMAIERFTAIYFPMRKTIFCTRKRAFAAIFLLFNVVCCSQLYVLIMVEKMGDNCSASQEYRKAYVKLYVYFYLLVLILALPAALIIVCNSMVVCKLFRYRQLTSKCNAENEDENTTWISQRRHKTTYMLITITSAYIITLLPITLCSVVFSIIFESNPKEDILLIYIAFEPYKHLLEIWASLNYSVNFFIYIVSGQMFRRELIRILCGRNSNSASVLKTRSTHVKEEIPLT